MAVDRDAPQVERFITLAGEPFLIRHNSRLPIVVYVSKGKDWLADTLGFGPVDGKRPKPHHSAEVPGVDGTPQGFGKARLSSLSVKAAMSAKTPICATERGMAGTGTPGDGAPVSAISAQGCQTPGIGTHGDVGTDGEGLMTAAEGGGRKARLWSRYPSTLPCLPRGPCVPASRMWQGLARLGTACPAGPSPPRVARPHGLAHMAMLAQMGRA